MANEKLKIEIIKDKFPDFINKITALTKIKDCVKLKITQDEIMMYSLQGETSILAFQNYLIKTKDYFIIDEFDFSIDFILLSPKKFVKSASFYNVTDDKNMKMTIINRFHSLTPYFLVILMNTLMKKNGLYSKLITY